MLPSVTRFPAAQLRAKPMLNLSRTQIDSSWHCCCHCCLVVPPSASDWWAASP